MHDIVLSNVADTSCLRGGIGDPLHTAQSKRGHPDGVTDGHGRDKGNLVTCELCHST